MKKLIILASLTLMSLNAFSAEVINCKAYGKNISNVIVPSEQTVSSIDRIIKSSQTTDQKINEISTALYIDAVSIGDGNSFCDLALLYQDVSNEKCIRVMRTKDIINQIILNANDRNVENLACRIGLEISVQLGFRM